MVMGMSNLNLQSSLNEAGVNAYVLINLTSGSENQVLKTAEALGCLKKAYPCFGIYDLVLEIKTDSLSGLKDLIHEYKNIKDVQSVLPLLVTRAFGKENSIMKEEKPRIFA